MAITLTVNAVEHALEADADTPLLWVLRDELKLKGTKFGCGIGQCGACTVQLDGNPIRSCQTPISLLAGRAVTTIEYLGQDGLHPLQLAWIEHNVPQCGYCQSGQLMTAEAFLRRNPSPTDDDVNWAMAGNLCRCGSYPRIRKAVQSAAQALRDDSRTATSPGQGDAGSLASQT